MENKKSKKILFITGIFDDMIPATIEIVKELTDLGHNITCYSLDKFGDSLKETGVKLKLYSINKNEFNKIPPFLLERAKLSIIMKNAYDFILRDSIKAKEKYDYLLFDSFFDGTEMNKIFNIPTVVSLYSSPLEEKTPFIEITRENRMRFLNEINKKYNINIRDYLSVRYIIDARYNIIFSSKLFQQKLKILNDTFYFIGPNIENKAIDESFVFKKDENKKLINISIDSLLHDNIEFYKMCIDTFKNSEEFQVIIDVGEKVDIKQFGDLPANISVFNDVPQHQILPITDIFITDTRMEPIIKGIFINNMPLIVIKQDLEHNQARLIEKSEVGISLDIKKLNKESLYKAINDFLSNKPYYMVRVEKIVNSFRESRNNRKKLLEEIFV